MAGAGALISFPQSTASTSRPLLIGLGILLVIAAAWGRGLVPRGAAGLTISGDGIEFRLLSGETLNVLWSDRNVKFTIYDWRSIPPTGRSRGLERVQFIVAPNRPVEAAVTRDVVDTIMDRARSRGFAVSGWTEEPKQIGRQQLIQISRPGGPATKR
jgi:hypothetical protein